MEENNISINYNMEEEPLSEPKRSKKRMQKQYPQKFRDEWLELDFCKDWLEKTSDPQVASCKYCSIQFGARFFGIKHHQSSKKHTGMSAAYHNVKEINIALPKVVKSERIDEKEVEGVRKRWGYLNDYFQTKYQKSKNNKKSKNEIHAPTFIEEEEEAEEPSISMTPNYFDPPDGEDRPSTIGYQNYTDGDYTVTNDYMPSNAPSSEGSNVYKNSKRVKISVITNAKSKTRQFPKRERSNERADYYDDDKKFDMEMFRALKKSEEYDDDDFFFKSLRPMMQELSGLQKLTFRTEVQNLLISFLKKSKRAKVLRTDLLDNEI